MHGLDRILIVTQRVPLPVRGGADLRVLQTTATARTLGTVGLVALTPPAASGSLRDVRMWVPEPGELRGGAAASAAWLTEPEGHPSDLWWTEASSAAVNRALDELAPDVVILEHLWTRRALAAAREAGAATVLVAHNVEAQTHEDLIAVAPAGAPAALARRLAERTARIEAATVAAVDQVWAVSEQDIERFRQRYSRCAPLRVVPNGIDTDALSLRAHPDDAPVILFPASFGYPPNSSAALWLAHDVLPLARARIPNLRLVLAGARPPKALRELAASDRGIVVTGQVEDMRPQFWSATAVAVPISVGGGSRYKILEAFATGAPVVSTAKGIEGIAARPGVEYLPASSAQEFAEAIVRLWNDRDLGVALASRARRLVEQCYSWASTRERVAAALGELPGGRAGQPNRPGLRSQ
jgi:glycosyltransferase involved in cell wall biosynthesis